MLEFGQKKHNKSALQTRFQSDTSFESEEFLSDGNRLSVATSYVQRVPQNNLAAKASEKESEKIDIMGILMSNDPQAAIKKLMKLPIKSFFKNGLSYRNL